VVLSVVLLSAFEGRDGTRCSLLRGIAGRVRKTVADQVDDEGFVWQWPPHPVGSVGEACCSGCDGSTGDFVRVLRRAVGRSPDTHPNDDETVVRMGHPALW